MTKINNIMYEVASDWCLRLVVDITNITVQNVLL